MFTNPALKASISLDLNYFLFGILQVVSFSQSTLTHRVFSTESCLTEQTSYRGICGKLFVLVTYEIGNS